MIDGEVVREFATESFFFFFFLGGGGGGGKQRRKGRQKCVKCVK